LGIDFADPPPPTPLAAFSVGWSARSLLALTTKILSWGLRRRSQTNEGARDPRFADAPEGFDDFAPGAVLEVARYVVLEGSRIG